MTYKRQMEKAIKEYMKSVGFKYYTPRYLYVQKVNDEILNIIAYATYNGGRKEYYELSIDICIIYRSWNNMLHRLTESYCDFDSFMNGPIYFPTRIYCHEPHVEIMGTRPMEENLAAYQKEMETRAFPILERYQDKEALYRDMMNEPNNQYLQKNRIWYLPVAHYVNGNYEEAIQAAKALLKECRDIQMQYPDAPAPKKNLNAATLYLKNLHQLIDGQELPSRTSPSAVTEMLQKLYKK